VRRGSYALTAPGARLQIAAFTKSTEAQARTQPAQTQAQCKAPLRKRCPRQDSRLWCSLSHHYGACACTNRARCAPAVYFLHQKHRGTGAHAAPPVSAASASNKAKRRCTSALQLSASSVTIAVLTLPPPRGARALMAAPRRCTRRLLPSAREPRRRRAATARLPACVGHGSMRRCGSALSFSVSRITVAMHPLRSLRTNSCCTRRLLP